ncbi:TIGR04282 family arsenosugar biosynthesis glycosyltransferase [Sulfuritalea sp.]|uniref:TIGR04282 family arsenosugar biosynthesis glycosyltransferase n=1 Tax=Sulfuritalea sp. TaxID=2480090 RepID=UPI001AC4C64B|nr:TIGR04282 family arsenosugar biosynthesis glycosyltransferase [Sulfuritalea sp.]MBN8476863.1 TIGR04282 family arsenosugar biosynthesis glycosyltransferase [Sulfuritalea sp.]
MGIALVSTEAIAAGEASGEPIGIAVMAKAPVAGYAKTRLIPALGAGGAARLHRQLTLRTLATACAADLGPVTLWCAPDTRHRFFCAAQNKFAVELRAQSGNDLGTRMARIFDTRGAAPLLLVGTDCPALDSAHLHAAARTLREGNDAAFVTTEDGGYFLIGLRKPVPELFVDIDWSTDHVMVQTRQRLAALGLCWQEVAMLWDVDRPEDISRWQLLQGNQSDV